MANSQKIKLNFNPKFVTPKGLIHYWPFNSHIQDVIGGAHLYNGNKACLVKDRFGRPLSALSFKAGSYQLPSTINYFPDDQFTLTV